MVCKRPKTGQEAVVDPWGEVYKQQLLESQWTCMASTVWATKYVCENI